MGDDREARFAALVGDRQALGLPIDAVANGARRPDVRARAATSAFEGASREPALSRGLARDDGVQGPHVTDLLQLFEQFLDLQTTPAATRIALPVEHDTAAAMVRTRW